MFGQTSGQVFALASLIVTAVVVTYAIQHHGGTTKVLGGFTDPFVKSLKIIQHPGK